MIDNLALFVVAGLLLNITPGPDVVYIVTNALRNGFKSGAVAALGIVAGCFVHILGAAIGLGALIAASATLFAVLKYIGAAYLVYIGVRMLFSRSPSALAGGEMPKQGLGQTFWRGFATNALNPKVALFFLAFVPQFIAHDAPNKALAFLLLGLLFNLNSLWVNIGWAAVAAWLAEHAAPVRNTMHLIERGAGLLFVGFGLKLADASLSRP
jgi:threonine/homoserine/homoserine lactone efflux protein